jgi:hypothetical protein
MSRPRVALELACMTSIGSWTNGKRLVSICVPRSIRFDQMSTRRRSIITRSSSRPGAVALRSSHNDVLTPTVGWRRRDGQLAAVRDAVGRLEPASRALEDSTLPSVYPLTTRTPSLTIALPMTRIHDTEKELQGTALSSLGAYPRPASGRVVRGNQPRHAEAADTGMCFQRW